jgi:membrane protease YdiL (CAAX protease family)
MSSDPNLIPPGPSSYEPAPAPAPAAPSPWSVRNLIILIVSGAIALITANLLTLTGYATLHSLLGWRTPPTDLRDNAFFLLALQTVFHALVLGIIYLFVALNHAMPFWATLRWQRLSLSLLWRFLPAGVVLALIVQLAPPLLPDRDDFPLTRLFTSPLAGYAIAAFAILIAPLMEELIFRGILFLFFEHLVGVRFAILGTALLFASLHVPEYWGAWNHVLLILFVGLVFSSARGLTGSLTPSILLHVAYNAALMVGLYFQTQGFRNLRILGQP